MKPDPSPLQQLRGDESPYLTDKLLDCQDMLQLFHISVRTLQHWRTKGLLPYSKIGNKIYYRAADVEEMLLKARQVGKK